MSKATKAEQEQARETLRALLPPGTTVYTIVKHVSRSGTQRSISCYVLQGDNPPRWIDSLVSKVTGAPFDDKREAVKMGGCGEDMGFSLVYNLSWCLWGKQFVCIGQGCPSNDHSNGDKDFSPHPHTDGGYALRHRWL